MAGWLPRPLLSAGLLIIWLLLNQTLAPAHLLLGAVIAIAVPRFTDSMMPHRMRLHSPLALARLIGWAVAEIGRSCFNVSRIILFRRHQDLSSEFIRIPLDLRDPYGLAMLSCLINCTPGTVWVEVLPDSHDLLLHVFDLHDQNWWVDTIKNRYEKPLIEAFEGKV
ncbi:Na+/H+ antiporter subunit E [uncultured Marinobacter sp.]|uniref:Na+/H+ antiporter subunit E n=1 Tax=uncultured Marinobacter sp. TaxID=187379 RepID=UPI0030D864E6